MAQDKMEISNQNLSSLNKNEQDRIQIALFDTRVTSVQQISDVRDEIDTEFEKMEIEAWNLL